MALLLATSHSTHGEAVARTIARRFRISARKLERGATHPYRDSARRKDNVVRAQQTFSEVLGVMLVEHRSGRTLADCVDWVAAVADVHKRPREARGALRRGDG